MDGEAAPVPDEDGAAAAPNKDVVFANVRIRVPEEASTAADGASDGLIEVVAVKQFEVLACQTTSPSSAVAVLALVTADGGSLTTERPLKVPHLPTLCLAVRELGMEAVQFMSQPLRDLRVGVPGARTGRLQELELEAWVDPNAEELLPPDTKGGAKDKAAKGGKGAPPAEEEERAASLSCDWRVQAALPPIVRHRTRPLAMSYAAPKDRDAFETRTNKWRREVGAAASHPSPRGHKPATTRCHRLPAVASPACSHAIARRTHRCTLVVCSLLTTT